MIFNGLRPKSMVFHAWKTYFEMPYFSMIFNDCGNPETALGVLTAEQMCLLNNFLLVSSYIYLPWS